MKSAHLISHDQFQNATNKLQKAPTNRKGSLRSTKQPQSYHLMARFLHE